jgi:hypothetical protein
MVVGLRRLNRQIEATYRSYCRGDGKPTSLPAHVGIMGPNAVWPWSFALFGFAGSPGASGLSAEGYLAECVRHKIITEKDCNDE